MTTIVATVVTVTADTVVTVTADIHWAKLTIWHQLGGFRFLISFNAHIVPMFHWKLTRFWEAGGGHVILHFTDKTSGFLSLKDMSKVTLLSRMDSEAQLICLAVTYPYSLYYTSAIPACGHYAPQMILCMFVLPFYFHNRHQSCSKINDCVLLYCSSIQIALCPKDKQVMASLFICVSISFHPVPDNKLNFWWG